MLKFTLLLIFAALWISNPAYSQKNSNCFNPTMPPMDVIAACDQNLASDSQDAQVYQARGQLGTGKATTIVLSLISVNPSTSTPNTSEPFTIEVSPGRKKES